MVVTIRHSSRLVTAMVPTMRKQLEHLMGEVKCEQFDIGVLLTTDHVLKRYNSKLRGKNRTTDVLSIPFHENLKPGTVPDISHGNYLGDMMVSVPYVKRYCQRELLKASTNSTSPFPDRSSVDRQLSESMHNHIIGLCVHSLCHLLGYVHETDEEFSLMTAKEEELMASVMDRRFHLAPE
eukprot:TRINITY_DN12632_c0_g1_i1.p1 TRINITY_DN12632_c0_g1~~TRINITY_DN12632_c0_g1_i1.p1  ORF type:complete len:180 (+),score=11.98 TRINITY_DN12632_c0_g1_i1:187-726(+)